jgi:hypothetical protein
MSTANMGTRTKSAIQPIKRTFRAWPDILNLVVEMLSAHEESMKISFVIYA